MIIGDIDFQILTTLIPNDITTSNNNPTYSYNNTVGGSKDIMELPVDKKNLSKTIVMHVNQQNKSLALTLLDFGASDHCFIDKTLFTTYTLLNQAIPSLGTGQDSIFQIIRKGSIKFELVIDRKVKKIILNNMLHTPNLRSNLISVSKLSKKGANILSIIGLYL